MIRNFCLWFIFLLLIVSTVNPCAGEENISTAPNFITIQLNNAIEVRNVFLPLFKQFELVSGIKVIPLRYIDDAEFSMYVDKNLDGTVPTPDVLNGLTSQPLFTSVQQGFVHPLTKLWQKNAWLDVFPKEVIPWISYHNEIYALPYTRYSWGLFFQQSLIEQFGEVPEQWAEFIVYCEKVKNAGFDVFPISKQQPWIASAWFEYITLRLHGSEFYQQVLDGNISYLDERMLQTFNQWKIMIDKGFFSDKYLNYKWEEQVPHFLRHNIAFMFMSTTLVRKVYDPAVLKNTHYMAFPKIADIPLAESAPTSLFFISKESKNIASAEKFLEFFAQPHVQTQIAQGLYSAPVNAQAITPDHNLIQKGINILNNAQSYSPFFDRAIPEQFKEPALSVLVDFLLTGDIENTVSSLEKSRITHYGIVSTLAPTEPSSPIQ